MPAPDRSIPKLWSRALYEVGVSLRIETVDDTGSEAAVCRDVYDDARDRVLAARPWRFAMKRLALPLVPGHPVHPDQPVPEWVYLYAYPADCVVARRLQDPSGRRPIRPDQRLAWSREFAGIYTNEPDAVLVYTMRHENISVWPAPCIEALKWAMASELALPISKKPELRDGCLRAYEWAIVRGSIPDLLEEEEGQEPESSFMAARR